MSQILPVCPLSPLAGTSGDRGPEASKPFERSHGRLVAFDENVAVKEGATPDGVVIVEWPTYEEALAHYESEAYQRVLHLRTGGAKGRLLIVHGVE